MLSQLCLRRSRGAVHHNSWAVHSLAKNRPKKCVSYGTYPPQDWHLLGVCWEGSVFVDQALPFGLRSAPLLFTAVADAIGWALIQAGASPLIHYLDDFLFFLPSQQTTAVKPGGGFTIPLTISGCQCQCMSRLKDQRHPLLSLVLLIAQDLSYVSRQRKLPLSSTCCNYGDADIQTGPGSSNHL